MTEIENLREAMGQQLPFAAPFNIEGEYKIFHVPILIKNHSVRKDIYYKNTDDYIDFEFFYGNEIKDYPSFVNWKLQVDQNVLFTMQKRNVIANIQHSKTLHHCAWEKYGRRMVYKSE
jgi:hypothetical protein